MVMIGNYIETKNQLRFSANNTSEFVIIEKLFNNVINGDSQAELTRTGNYFEINFLDVKKPKKSPAKLSTFENKEDDSK